MRFADLESGQDVVGAEEQKNTEFKNDWFAMRAGRGRVPSDSALCVFRRRTFALSQALALGEWQPNKNNHATEHTNNIKIAQPKRVSS